MQHKELEGAGKGDGDRSNPKNFRDGYDYWKHCEAQEKEKRLQNNQNEHIINTNDDTGKTHSNSDTE